MMTDTVTRNGEYAEGPQKKRMRILNIFPKGQALLKIEIPLKQVASYRLIECYLSLLKGPSDSTHSF
jgi:hypothetical protein